MQVNKSVRDSTRKVLGPDLTRYLRRTFSPRVRNLEEYRSQLMGKLALEIGGPSEVFGEFGPLSIYDVLKRADNCLFSSRTVWTGAVQCGRTFRYIAKRKRISIHL